MANQPKLSIVVPAYKEEKSIYQTVKRIVDVYDDLPYEYEVIVVVDGSPDKTAEEARRVESPNVNVVEYFPNQGRGTRLSTALKKLRERLLPLPTLAEILARISLINISASWNCLTLTLLSVRNATQLLESITRSCDEFIRVVISGLLKFYLA